MTDFENAAKLYGRQIDALTERRSSVEATIDEMRQLHVTLIEEQQALTNLIADQQQEENRKAADPSRPKTKVRMIIKDSRGQRYKVRSGVSVPHGALTNTVQVLLDGSTRRFAAGETEDDFEVEVVAQQKPTPAPAIVEDDGAGNATLPHGVARRSMTAAERMAAYNQTASSAAQSPAAQVVADDGENRFHGRMSDSFALMEEHNRKQLAKTQEERDQELAELELQTQRQRETALRLRREQMAAIRPDDESC